MNKDDRANCSHLVPARKSSFVGFVQIEVHSGSSSSKKDPIGGRVLPSVVLWKIEVHGRSNPYASKLTRCISPVN